MFFEIIRNLRINIAANIIKNIRIITAEIFTIIILSTSSIAQIEYIIGPKIGLVNNSFRGADKGKMEPKLGWVGGLFFNLPLDSNSFFIIQPELMINEKSAIQTKNYLRNTIDILYFELPVLFKYELCIQHIYFPHLLIGPNFAYNIHSDISSTNIQTGEVDNVKSGDINRFDIGGIAGAGIDLKKDWIFITLDVRYGLGFVNIGKNGDNNLTVKNTGWSIAIGIGERFSCK